MTQAGNLCFAYMAPVPRALKRALFKALALTVMCGGSTR
jgi:hypothetical protein